MQDNEVLMSFPQPSQNYDGPLLDPLLAEEDFTQTVGVVRRFASGGPDFTDQRILEHLAANGVCLYGSQGDWDTLFAEIRDCIVKDAAENEPPVEISWVVRQLGEKAIYSMVGISTTEAAEALRAEEVDVRGAVKPETFRAEQAVESGEDRTLLDGVRNMLGESADGKVRLKELVSAIAGKLGVTPAEANQLIGKAVSAGRFSKLSSGGIAYVTEFMEGQPAVPVPQEAETPDRYQAAETELADLDAYMKVVGYVMGSLAALRDISMGQSYDRLWRRSGLEKVMDFPAFKRYVRRMGGDGLVRIDNDAKLSTTTARSQILRGSKVLVGNKHIRASWKVNSKKNLHEMYEAALEKLVEDDEDE